MKLSVEKVMAEKLTFLCYFYIVMSKFVIVPANGGNHDAYKTIRATSNIVVVAWTRSRLL